MNILLLSALLLLPAAAARAASTSQGTSGAQFLKLGAGARAGAMADAMTAAEGDAFSVYYNPAALSRLERAQLGGAHSQLFQGISYQALAFAKPFGMANGREGVRTKSHKHAVGLGIFYLSVGELERRTGDSTAPVGTFNAADAAYVGSYSWAPDERLSLGVSGKYISQTLDSYNGSSFGADLGVLYRLNPESERPVSIGAAVRNAGKSIGYVSSAQDPLPTSFHLGASGRPFRGLALSLEAGKYRDTDVYGALGLEGRKTLGEGLAASLRAGYSTKRRANEGLNEVSAGGGLSFQRASLDAAWIPFGTLGNSFRFSLLLKF